MTLTPILGLLFRHRHQRPHPIRLDRLPAHGRTSAERARWDLCRVRGAPTVSMEFFPSRERAPRKRRPVPRHARGAPAVLDRPRRTVGGRRRGRGRPGGVPTIPEEPAEAVVVEEEPKVREKFSELMTLHACRDGSSFRQLKGWVFPHYARGSPQKCQHKNE